MRAKIIIVNIAAIAAVIIANIIVRSNSVSYIQNNGLRSYAAMLDRYTVISIILIVLNVIIIIWNLISTHKANKKHMENQARAAEEKRKNIKNQKSLDDDYIYDALQQWKEKDWGEICGNEIDDILKQLDEMNRYQNKFAKLISNNNAAYLNDSINVLENVEQYFLRNVKKVLNCLDVYDAYNKEDENKVRHTLTETREDNDVQLKNIKEFLIASTDFLNRQNDDKTDLRTLEIYKETILNSLREVDEENETILKF